MNEIFRSTAGILLYILLAVLLIVIPLFLTVWNIVNSFLKKPKLDRVMSTITVILGGVYYAIALLLLDLAGDWHEVITDLQLHYPISSEYWWMAWFLVPGIIGYFILLYFKPQKLPPLISVLSISSLILFNVVQVVFLIQMVRNSSLFFVFFLCYHFNITLLSARVVCRHMKAQVALVKTRKEDLEQHKGIAKFFDKIDTLSKYTIVVFVVFFILVAIIEIICVLLGQGLDAPIKAFTDTADWTFSQQIPPAPIDGHYLCTVAAGGHKKVVKPLRLGTRRGGTIVVNRQLCIANAFEEVIQEKFPKFHRWIRHEYDTHGYPLSRKITTPLRADLTYYLMKPLEWCFLAFLYLVDLRPEQRIGRQYAYVGEARE